MGAFVLDGRVNEQFFSPAKLCWKCRHEGCNRFRGQEFIRHGHSASNSSQDTWRLVGRRYDALGSGGLARA